MAKAICQKNDGWKQPVWDTPKKPLPKGTLLEGDLLPLRPLPPSSLFQARQGTHLGSKKGIGVRPLRNAAEIERGQLRREINLLMR